MIPSYSTFKIEARNALRRRCKKPSSELSKYFICHPAPDQSEASFIVILTEEEKKKKRLYANRVKPLNKPQAELLDWSVNLTCSVQTGVF